MIKIVGAYWILLGLVSSVIAVLNFIVGTTALVVAGAFFILLAMFFFWGAGEMVLLNTNGPLFNWMEKVF